MKLFHKVKIKHVFGFLMILNLSYSQSRDSNQILDHYIIVGLENNPSIQQMFNHWKAAETKITFAKGLPNPSISFGYFLESVETAAGPQEYKIGIMQNIPWFGKRKIDGNIQSAKAELAFTLLEKKRLKISHEIRQIWYDYYYLKRLIDLTQQNFELIQNWDSVIRSKYVTSRTGHPDLIKTQIELIQLEDDLLSLENQKQPLLESFRSLLHDQTLSEITVPESLSFSIINLDRMYLLNIINDSNPDLESVRSELKVYTEGLKKAKLSKFPTIAVGVEKILTGEKSGSTFSGNNPLIAKLSLNIPLWIRKNNSTIKSVKFSKQATEKKVISIKNELGADLGKVLYDLREGERHVLLYQNVLIPKGLESLSATEKAYRSENIDFLSLVDAQQRLLKFQMKYEKSLISYLKAISKLSVMTGEKIL
ncbi:MAG: TolC family protein [Candidatus Marinimicrobia bacterium]|nr:TolC family protein [Candidatus Neomarinimicrobiota bacterium]